MNRTRASTTLAIVMAGSITSAAHAQVPPYPAAAPPQWLPPQIASTYQSQSYPFAAPTPADAYREGLLNRWEYERYEPLPPALQGPPANGSRGGDGGGGKD